MARQKRRQYGSGCLLKRGRGWAIRWREMEIAPDGTQQRVLRYESLGEVTRKEAATALAQRVAVGGNNSKPTRSRVRSEPWRQNGRLTCCRCTSTRRRETIGTFSRSICCRDSVTWR